MIRRFSLAVGLFLGLWTGTIEKGFGAQSNPDIKFKVQLIWGTNDDKPKSKEGDLPLKEIDPKLKEKLSKIFTWKNYFEVGSPRKDLVVKSGETGKSQISRKCDIEVKNLGESKVALKLFGDGKQVVQQTHQVKHHEPVVLAGHAENETAWFVVLTPE